MNNSITNNSIAIEITNESLIRQITTDAVLDVFQVIYNNRNKAYNDIPDIFSVDVSEDIYNTCMFENEDFAEIEYEFENEY